MPGRRRAGRCCRRPSGRSCSPRAGRDAPVAAAVAPGAPELGVMLPYSPLHHLLLGRCRRAAGDDERQRVRRADRLPRRRCPRRGWARSPTSSSSTTARSRRVPTTASSGSRAWRGRPAPRSCAARGATSRRASPLPEGGTPRPLLACGAELKSTFCVAKGERAWVSHHIGDLENYETLRLLHGRHRAFRAPVRVSPEVVAHDLHPEYLSTKYALERDGVELIAVQHHHAHLAACLAEARRDRPRPPGDGRDLRRDRLRDRRDRLGRRVPAGGPARVLRGSGRSPRSRCPAGRPRSASRGGWPARGCGRRWATSPELPATLAGAVSPRAWDQIGRLVQTRTASPPTTSMGRLCDAVGALCGIRPRGQLRGPGGDRARGGLRSGRARRL